MDSVIQPLPFSRHGLCIQDTGAMYVINTPAGINIKWAHVTGIIDIQYGFHSNTSTKTEGLCGENVFQIFICFVCFSYIFLIFFYLKSYRIFSIFSLVLCQPKINNLCHELMVFFFS